jgi:thiamine kinase-like enzyme
MVPSRYQAAWPKFRDLFRGQLSASALALGDHLSLHLETLLEQIEQRPRTIVHSDFRADNLLFDLPTDPQPVVILDWQLAIRSTGMLDVARLLCGSMDPLDRAACEMEIVERWHETLEVRGVRGYSLKQAIADYKTCAWISLYYPVTIHEAEEAAGKRGTALAHAQIQRFFTAAEELNV